MGGNAKNSTQDVMIRGQPYASLRLKMMGTALEASPKLRGHLPGLV
jgi:hypothetical protein